MGEDKELSSANQARGYASYAGAQSGQKRIYVYCRKQRVYLESQGQGMAHDHLKSNLPLLRGRAQAYMGELRQ